MTIKHETLASSDTASSILELSSVNYDTNRANNVDEAIDVNSSAAAVNSEGTENDIETNENLQQPLQISKAYIRDNDTVEIPNSMKILDLDQSDNNGFSEIAHNPYSFLQRFSKSVFHLVFTVFLNFFVWTLFTGVIRTQGLWWFKILFIPFLFFGLTQILSYFDSIFNSNVIKISNDTISIERLPIRVSRKVTHSSIHNLVWERSSNANDIRYKVESIKSNGEKEIVFKFHKKKEAKFLVQEFHRNRSNKALDPISNTVVTAEMKRNISQHYLQQNNLPETFVPQNLKIEYLDSNKVEIEIAMSASQRFRTVFCCGLFAVAIIVGCIFGVITAFSEKSDIQWFPGIWFIFVIILMLNCFLPLAFDSTFITVSSDAIIVENRPIGKKCSGSLTVTDIKNVFFLAKESHHVEPESHQFSSGNVFCVDVETLDEEEQTILRCRNEEEAKFIVHEFHKIRSNSPLHHVNELI